VFASGTVLKFKYVVAEGDSTPSLDTWRDRIEGQSSPLVVRSEDGDFIRRLTTASSTAANVGMEEVLDWTVPTPAPTTANASTNATNATAGSGSAQAPAWASSVASLNATSLLELDGLKPVLVKVFVEAVARRDYSSQFGSSSSPWGGALGSPQRLDAAGLLGLKDGNVTLGVGDVVFVNVTWSAPVALVSSASSSSASSSSSPKGGSGSNGQAQDEDQEGQEHMLWVDAGDFMRAAVYDGGNNTAFIRYK
jgi:hypothetical protein